MSDADIENTEIPVSLDFCIACRYITQKCHQELIALFFHSNILLKNLYFFYLA